VEYGNPDYNAEDDLYSTDYGFGLLHPDSQTQQDRTFQRNYTWNERNLLQTTRDNSYTVHYRYGVDGQRALKYTEQGGKEQLYFNKMYQLSSTEGYENWIENKHIYIGETRMVTARNEGRTSGNTVYQKENRFYYHSDHLGSAQLVTDFQGNTYERIEYTPYGESWIEWRDHAGGYETPFRFSSKERDAETGLYYYGARYMSPRESRWMSADPALGEYIPSAPISDEARDKNNNLPGMGGIFNIVNMHLYHYAGNNPLSVTDPNGEVNVPIAQVFLMNQNNAEWLDEPINGDPSDATIELAGCAIAGMANLSISTGGLMTPFEINNSSIVSNGDVNYPR
jgi:RHS repeat-associated protein